MKLCQIYESASHYRQAIYQLLDKEIGCDWIFGPSCNGIKEADLSKLNGKVTKVNVRHFGPLIWQSGTMRALFMKYDTYVFLGNPHSVDVWITCLISRIFFPKKRLFFWTHGWYGRESVMEGMLKKLFFHLPNGGIFLYGNYAKELMLKEGFKEDRLFVVHNSLDYDRQLEIRNRLQQSDVYLNHFGNNYPVLLFVGRLTKSKNLEILIEAMKISDSKNKKYNLILIGQGEQMSQLKQTVKRIGLENRVWFYGACYDDVILGDLIYNADLCVSPGFVGLTAMHAMVYGTPVCTHDDICYQAPEFEAIHQGRTGCFFKKGDTVSLSQSIDTWMETMNLIRDEIRKACFHEIDNYWTPRYQLDVIKGALCGLSLKGQS